MTAREEKWTRRERFLSWFFFRVGRAKYRLGLSHQFSCRECGWPQLEQPAHGDWYRWYCPHCGRVEGGRFDCVHAPRVMKKQHRIVGCLRLLWREIQE